MAKFILTTTDRYKIEADNAKQAMVSYYYHTCGIEPELYGLTIKDLVQEKAIEYLDGTTETIEEEN